MENEHLGHIAELGIKVRLRPLPALIALVLVVRVELADFEVFLQALRQGRFVAEGQRRERFVCLRFVAAALAPHYGSGDAREQSIDYRWVRDEVLFIDVAHGPILVLLCDVTIEFRYFYRRLFVLQLTEHVDEKLVAIMLHRWVESLANQVLQASRIEDDLLPSVVLERIVEEFCDFSTVLIRVGHRAGLVEALELLVDVVVP